MSLALLRSRALAGMHAPLVTVEVHLANGLPSFTIVGLPEAEVKEARDRVRAALQNARFDFPARRITVNLAPADLPKASARFDLAIALGILAASGQVPDDQLERYEFAGELSLSGQLNPIRGALAMACAMHGEDPSRAFILPAVNAGEAALVEGATILPAHSLLEVCAHFCGRDGQGRLARHTTAPVQRSVAATHLPDFDEVKGQSQARRALEVAAAGSHSILLVGPPGTGKSMLANRLPGILPAMDEKQALQAAAIQALGPGFDATLWKRRPFRAPHHTASAVALVGGGSPPKPGEISLAHHGVLFLDELPEFKRHVLEVLREPLETGHITISRAAHQAEFPARFQLVAAMNPCPCGYLGHDSGRCRCTPDNVARYQGRISGPLLDRIDMQVSVGALAASELDNRAVAESSAAIAMRTASAHARQLQRQDKPNGHLGTRELEMHCRPDGEGEALLRQAMQRLDWSARAYHRVLKLARTIADLAGCEQVGRTHVAEAVQYRRGFGER